MVKKQAAGSSNIIFPSAMSAASSASSSSEVFVVREPLATLSKPLAMSLSAPLVATDILRAKFDAAFWLRVESIVRAGKSVTRREAHPLCRLRAEFKTRANILKCFIAAAEVTEVHDTRNNETHWLCVLSHDTGRWWLSKTVAETIIAHQKRVQPTYAIARTSCKFRLGAEGRVFKYVFWRGFKEPTVEYLDDLNVSLTSVVCN